MELNPALFGFLGLLGVFLFFLYIFLWAWGTHSANRDITFEAPLPVDMEIVPPGPRVPVKMAEFSGTWEGEWNNGIKIMLVVEKIDPPEAVIIYSWGFLKVGKPRAQGWDRNKGTINNDVITFYRESTQGQPVKIILKLQDKSTLEASYESPGTPESPGFLHATLKKKPPAEKKLSFFSFSKKRP